MTQNLFMHALGYASLTAIFCAAGATAVTVITRSLNGNAAKITAALRGDWIAGKIRAAAPRPRHDFLPESTNAGGLA